MEVIMVHKNEIRNWLETFEYDEYVTFVLIVCDTFDYSDYPVLVTADDDVMEMIAEIDGNNMQKVVEVYDMSLDIEEQLDEKIAWHVPKGE